MVQYQPPKSTFSKHTAHLGFYQIFISKVNYISLKYVWGSCPVFRISHVKFVFTVIQR